MEVRVKLRILLGVAFLWALPSWTADAVQPLDVKPGLWETTTTTEMGGMPPMPADVLAKMTPEQRAKFEAAMKARAAQGAKTTTRRTCLDQGRAEQAPHVRRRRQVLPAHDHQFVPE